MRNPNKIVVKAPLSGLGCIICIIRAAKAAGGSFAQEGRSACRTWIPCLVARGIRRRDAIAILWERRESGMTSKGREGSFWETRREIPRFVAGPIFYG
ncbi:hypothetical protein CEXT_175691 [Caerostris extrusa]|uniref:Secreted protein n=1 Tax=Caerostris extrusa TaxID=172846 RepID=A0AAV4MC85_CAEEX|nr:hypothetical protein CEXT_175691 [Caerostris extrusa]